MTDERRKRKKHRTAIVEVKEEAHLSLNEDDTLQPQVVAAVAAVPVIGRQDGQVTTAPYSIFTV